MPGGEGSNAGVALKIAGAGLEIFETRGDAKKCVSLHIKKLFVFTRKTSIKLYLEKHFKLKFRNKEKLVYFVS